tara:strand:- start:501 stop:2252 length:1752 start_codon:yes stop_codon:yes gene_type:complete
MLLIKLSNFVSKIIITTIYLCLLLGNLNGEESIDIWKNQKGELNKNNEIKNINQEPKINVLKKNNTSQQITIVDEKDSASDPVQLLGLHDPGKNDLTLNMWVNTDGELIRNTFNRIAKINLSDFSEELFEEVIFTYSYPPNKNLSQEDFLKLKVNWLISKSKIKLIEDFLNNNLEFSERSKLIKYLVDHYIATADISKSCENANFINMEIKDNYLDKFRIYCLILNNKIEQAQINFDLLREEKRSDKFFDNKILFLLGINTKSDNKISDKNLLYFYLSSITVDNFKYEPTQKTEKNIWKYLTASNLISTNELQNPEIINKYEYAANEGNFDKDKIFEIYLSLPFNINQLINAKTVHLSLSGYEARALIYQKILLTEKAENKLDFLFILKDLFEKDKLNNIYKDYLSDTLKSINPDKIPNSQKKLVSQNIILEKNNSLGKIKYDDKILHRSKAIKSFTEESSSKEKVNKEFLNIYKKISKNKKYFFSTKDVILLETLNSDGYIMPKELDISSLSKNLTIPPNINELIKKDEIGMLMLKLVEIIGSDDVENLDPETLYFIVSLLNKAKIKKVRNKILNLTLPLRV